MAIHIQNHLAETAAVKHEICDQLQIPYNSEEARKILKVVLHAIRNRLNVEQKVSFMAYLPSSLLALFTEDWSRVDLYHEPMDSLGALLREIEQEASDAALDYLQNEPEALRALYSVFNIIREHTSLDNMRLLNGLFPDFLNVEQPEMA